MVARKAPELIDHSMWICLLTNRTADREVVRCVVQVKGSEDNLIFFHFRFQTHVNAKDMVGVIDCSGVFPDGK